MSELPSGWIEATVAELIEDYQSGFASGKKDAKQGLKQLRMNNITINGTLDLSLTRTVPKELASARHFLSKGDVVICTTNSSKLVGKVAYFDLEGEFAFSNHLTRLRTDDKFCSSRFLYYYLLHYWKQHGYEEKSKHWVNQSSLPKEELMALPAPLAPLNEQKRIVAKLDELLPKVEACKERLQKIPTILKRFRQSVLAAAVSGKLTEEWRKERKIKDGEDLPGGWSSVQLREVVEKFDYGSSAKSDKTGSVPVLRMGNIQNGEIDWADLVYSNNQNEIKKYLLAKNTVLFNRTNSPELVGKTAIYRGDRPAMFAGYLIRLICGSRMNPEYLNLCLNSPLARNWCREVKSDGVSQSNINAQKLADYEITLPPIEEQAEIVEQVNHQLAKVDKTLCGAVKALKYVNRCVDAILSKAFAGSLVSQDPTDEPASVLLERIKQLSAQNNSGAVKSKSAKRGRKVKEVQVNKVGSKSAAATTA